MLAHFCSITLDKRFYQLQCGKCSLSLLSLTWPGLQDRELAEKEDFSDEGKYFGIQDGIFSLLRQILIRESDCIVIL